MRCLIRLSFLPFLVLLVSGCISQKWEKHDAEEYLSVPIPSDAKDLDISGRRDLGGFLDLRFAAPPYSALQFAHNFCKGKLMEGFDPFHAVIVESDTSHPIDMGYYIYYAYSPDTLSTIHGNRCPYFRIALDQSDPSLFRVHLRADYSHHDPNEYPVEHTGTPIWFSPTPTP